MLLFPDPDTAVLDPFRQHKTLNINCFVKDPVTGESYTRDPRYIAQKAEDYLVSTGIADTAYLRPRGGVLHLRRRPLRAGHPLGLLLGRLDRGGLEHGQGRGARTWATSPGTRRAISRSRRWTTSRTCAPR